jgi:hypothetical protein
LNKYIAAIANIANKNIKENVRTAPVVEFSSSGISLLEKK